MNIRNIEKINELFKETLDETGEFFVEGYCSYGKSKRTDKYRYSSLVDESGKFKINLLEGKDELIDGIFYILKVRFYPRQGYSEFRLKVIDVVEKFENKLLINRNYFIVLKNKIDKGFIDIDNYLRLMVETSNKISVGFITLKTSIAYDDIFSPIEKDHKDLILINRFDISTDSFQNTFLKMKGIEKDIDLWVITRGGGDLTFFNSLELLKEVAYLNKPIITALGHSTDKTLTDLCSDRYFETPTSLGNYLNQTLKRFYLDRDKHKESKDILLKKTELEKQVNILKNKVNKNEKLILSQSTEIDSYKKLLAKSIANSNGLIIIIFMVSIIIFVKILID